MKHNGIRPQDIVILLKKTTSDGKNKLNKDIANSLGISASEVSESMERSRISQLVDNCKERVNILALKDLLVYGLRYVFPIQLGNVVRGIPTFTSALPISDKIMEGKDKYVWPSKNGTIRGISIEPLYKTVTEAVAQDDELYQLLVITDTLRIGRVREREIAIQELDKHFEEYGKH